MACADPLEVLIGQRLSSQGRTLATAESCTGGLIAHRITNVPGASAYFLGGLVAYSNAVKVEALGVARADLDAHGAVSEPVAREMAEGVRTRFGADLAIGVTGIAGPTGGTAEKPVGLVFISVASEGKTWVARHVFPGSREEVKRQAAENALQLLWEHIG